MRWIFFHSAIYEVEIDDFFLAAFLGMAYHVIISWFLFKLDFGCTPWEVLEFLMKMFFDLGTMQTGPDNHTKSYDICSDSH